MSGNKSFKFDRDTIKINCDEFYALYNFTHGDVKKMCSRKIIHTYEVAGNCRFIAEGMGLDEYDCNMAWAIGELHDFARFGQAVKTHTFVDSEKYDHARMGARLLFAHHLVDDIIPGYDDLDDTDKKVMEKAVLYHGVYKLPADLSEREKLFCEIIRDADKIDIFRNIIATGCEEFYGCSLEEIEKEDISPAIEEAFYEHRTADYKKRVTKADFYMAHIALFFGLTGDISRQRAIEQGYLLKMMEIEFKDPAVQKKYAGMKGQILKYIGKTS